MAQNLKNLSTKLAAGAAGAAGQLSATTTAEMQGVAAILEVLALRPDLARPIMALAFSKQKAPFNPSEPAGHNQVTPG